jgi:hypothetical protein
MRQSLIFSRRNDNGVLTVEDMQQRAPAMFSDTKAERLTDRYAAFRTADLLPIMADYDYFPVQAAQKRPTKNSPTKAEHKTHMVAFSKGGDQGDGQTRGEIIVYNSHDGSSALRLFAGAYRFICSNGIVAGEGMQQRIYHTTKSIAGFEQSLRSVIEALPSVLQQFEVARNINLDGMQQYELAKQAVMKRWGAWDDSIVDVDGRPIKGSYAVDKTIRDALGVQRSEDNLSDAFTVWNRIQENVLRGNVMIKSITDNNVGMRKARPVTAVAEHVRINRELFDLLPA